MDKTRELLEQLIARPSITPQDAGCQRLLRERLVAIGFACETIHSGAVTNLWAKKGDGRPLFVFAGHTDVVPPGPREQWHTDPFVPTVREGKLYGRGASDMKASLAAMVVATEEFIAAHPDHQGAIGFLLTSDEEGPATDGTTIVCQHLQQRGESLDFCLVGEPTSEHCLGDVIKNGRRGSLSGKLTIYGVQGHIAYLAQAKNPIHLAIPALAELIRTTWDAGNAAYSPTSWQISNLHAGLGATNVTPAELVVDFNFRFSTASTVQSLQARLTHILNHHALKYHVNWVVGGQAFFTPQGKLSQALSQAIYTETGIQPRCSTSGGTSDGRFIAQICPQVIDFGPCNDSIHQMNEYIYLDAIEPLKNIYCCTLENLLL